MRPTGGAAVGRSGWAEEIRWAMGAAAEHARPRLPRKQGCGCARPNDEAAAVAEGVAPALRPGLPTVQVVGGHHTTRAETCAASAQGAEDSGIRQVARASEGRLAALRKHPCAACRTQAVTWIRTGEARPALAILG